MADASTFEPLVTDFLGERETDRWEGTEVEQYRFIFENGYGVSLLRGQLPGADTPFGRSESRNTVGYENGNWEAMIAEETIFGMVPIFKSELYDEDDPIAGNLDNAGVNRVLATVSSWEKGGAK